MFRLLAVLPAFAATPAKHHPAHHAGSTAASSALSGALSLLVILALLAGFIALLVYISRRQRASADKNLADRGNAMRAFFRDAYTKDLQPVAVNLNLTPGEQCYYASPATQYSLHNQRAYGGTYGGPSVRIARGVSLRLGASRGSSHTVSGMASDGTGTLYVTNSRFVFVGVQKTTVTPFDRIADVAPFEDGLHIDIMNGSPLNYGTGDQGAWIVYQRLHDGTIKGVNVDELDATTKTD